jgi:hypothetical protein
MEKTPAWKLALLDDAIPKFTAAVQACKNVDDTTEIQAPARNFIRLLQEIMLVPESSHLMPTDPQELIDPNST